MVPNLPVTIAAVATAITVTAAAAISGTRQRTERRAFEPPVDRV
jgi:hypothetical protein